MKKSPVHKYEKISIHSLRAEVDVNDYSDCLILIDISIHSLRAEVDRHCIV